MGDMGGMGMVLGKLVASHPTLIEAAAAQRLCSAHGDGRGLAMSNGPFVSDFLASRVMRREPTLKFGAEAGAAAGRGFFWTWRWRWIEAEQAWSGPTKSQVATLNWQGPRYVSDSVQPKWTEEAVMSVICPMLVDRLCSSLSRFLLKLGVLHWTNGMPLVFVN